MGSTAKAELLAPGAQVGRYHLLRRLAIGGMAELHLACAEGVAGFQKVVVLKRVLPHLAADEDFVELFINEARLAANLDHPTLVQVMDIGEAEGEYFYVMEYVHGRNARDLLVEAANRGGMPLAVALTMITAVASGLHHAHERSDLEGRPLGLVHRDVSPSNVLVSYDGGVKVTDFGIAKASARTAETIGGAMKGKIGYMSPEQCRGEAVDRRSDVFALGILLYELTTTERLFYAESDFAVLNQVVHGRFERPSERVPGYAPQLERIVLRALSREPAQRYPSAEALLRDVEAFAHEQHLLCSSAVVADWMSEAFGRPPFPRVEHRPVVPADPLDAIPTLVLVDGLGQADPQARTRAEPLVAGTFVAPGSSGTMVAPGNATVVASGHSTAAALAGEPIRGPRRRGWRGLVTAGVVVAAAAIGYGIWGGSVEAPPVVEETPSSTRVESSAPRGDAPVSPRAPENEGAGEAEPEAQPVAEPEPEAAAPVQPDSPSRPSRSGKKKRKKHKRSPRGKASAVDPDVLYPVGR